jgi:hypothetical protein
MKRALCPVGLALVGLVLLTGLPVSRTGAAEGQAGGPIEAALTFRPFQDAAEMEGLTWGGVDELLAPGRNGGCVPPAGITRTAAARFQLPWMTRPLAALFGKSPESAWSYDCLWLDWNNDRACADSERLDGVREGRWVRFGPVEQTAWDGTRMPAFHLLVRDNDSIQIVPTGYHEGEVTLGDRKLRVAAVDRNLDGMHGQEQLGEDKRDVLLVDFDRDGRFSGAPQDWIARVWEIEALHLTSRMQMPDGAYYRVTVARDGSRLTLRSDQTPLGRIKVPTTRVAMEVKSPEGPFLARSTTGELALPAGTYGVRWLALSEKDAAGEHWTAEMRLAGPGWGRLGIAAGQVTDLPWGPPFQLGLQVRQSGQARRFAFRIKDRAGNEVRNILTPAGGRPAAPQLTILNSGGKLVKSQKFHYG